MTDHRVSPLPTKRVLDRRRFLAGLAASAGAAVLAACGGAADATVTVKPAATTGPVATTGAVATTAPVATTAATAAMAMAASTPMAMAAATSASGATAVTTPALVVGAGKGKTLKMARNAEPFSGFVGWSSEDNATLFVLINIYESLLKTSKDGLRVEPSLATSWETSTDGLTWTFHLRDNAKFSDGSPVRGKDVVASINQCRMGPKTQWKSTYKAIKDVQAPDDKTVLITLIAPHAPLLAELAMWTSAVFPADMAVKVDTDGFDTTKTVGSGAYLCEGWKKGDPIILKRNPYYWKGAVGPDVVQIEYVPDDNSRLLKLQGGEVDVIDFVPLSQIQSLSMQGAVKAQAFTIQQLSTLILNVKIKPLDDVKVRQALNYALDKDAILKAVYFGQAQFQNSPIPPGTYWDKTLPGYPFNLDKAKQLIADSSAAKGATISLSLPSGDTISQQIATIAKDQWAKIGITINIENLESSTLRQNRKDGKIAMSRGGWTNDMNDPTEVCNAVLKGDVSPFASYSFYDNKDLDDKITQADLEQDPVKRGAIYGQIQKIFLDDAANVFIAYPPATAGWQKYVEGFAIDGLSYYRFEEVLVKK